MCTTGSNDIANVREPIFYGVPYTTGSSYHWIFFSAASLGKLFFWLAMITISTHINKEKTFTGFGN